MNEHPLRILLLEDSPTDAELAERELRRANIVFVLHRVETQDDFEHHLHAFRPDVVVADYALPTFDGISALAIVREQTPDMPFVIFSGSLGDERAVEVLKQGANDYVLKDRMHRLPAAILRARQDSLDRLERRRVGRELQQEKDFVLAVINATASLVAVLDTKGLVVRTNPAFERATGKTREELTGLSWEAAFPSEPVIEFARVISEVFAGQSSQFEVTLLGPDGSRRSIVWQTDAIRGVNGHPPCLVLTGIDLTEMRRLEQQIEQTRRIDSLGRVAATVAHEFNNVLMIIGSSAAILRRQIALEKVASVAESIEQAVMRGSRITQEVMRFARPAEPAVQPIAVNAWITALVNDVRRMLKSNITLEVLLPLDELEIAGDAEQLYQVFSNVLINARDALAGGGGSITLTVDEIDEQARFTVHDTGPGIPPDVLVRIFEPFFTTKRAGTGLGLAVAFQTIVAHGGQIFAESDAAGTTFHVLLPRLS